jgi:F0F1-type ATP synthase assembly protein I
MRRSTFDKAVEFINCVVISMCLGWLIALYLLT